MNEMGTKFVKGKKRTRIVALALLFVMLLCCIPFAAQAASDVARFQVTTPTEIVSGKYEPIWTETETSDKVGRFSYWDWNVVYSRDQEVPLGEHNLFVIPTAPDKAPSNVYMLRVIIDRGGSDSGAPIKVAVNTAQNNKISHTKLTEKTVTITYRDKESGISADDANQFFNRIRVTLNSKYAHGTAKITVKAYRDAYSTADKYRVGDIYRANVRFFTYAHASLVNDTLKVSYANSDTTHNRVDPDDTNKGRATFQVQVNKGDLFGKFENPATGEKNNIPLKEVVIGYSIKKDTDSWEKGDIVYGQQKFTQANMSKLTKPVTVTVKDFDANQNYDVKAVVITEGKTDALQETKELRIRYDKPSINSFNVGDTTAAYQGGTIKQINIGVAFNNTNYDGLTDQLPFDFDETDKTEEDIEAARFDGAATRITLKFTSNFNQESKTVVDDHNNEVVQVTDKSVWETLASHVASYTPENRNFSYTYPHTLPKVDSKNCAYKLEVTDLVTGYTVYSYSLPFTVDANAPTDPEVRTANDLVSKEELADGSGAPVGGANASVTLDIGKSEDLASGVKEYSYNMYYISADAGDAFATRNAAAAGVTLSNPITAQNVLQVLKGMTEGETPLIDLNTETSVEYTSWTTLPEADAETGFTKLSVAKDGYYCVRARATDKVEKTSGSTVALFRVDLSAPDAPTARLVATEPGAKVDVNVSGNNYSLKTPAQLAAYDERTYSDKTVWAFVKCVPQTGKTIDTSKYEFSLDGGLTWTKVSSVWSAADKKYINVAGELPETYNGTSYSSKEKFSYDVGFQLSSDQISGYQNVLFRAYDTLGNSSLPSAAVKMRTSDNITAQGSMTHDGIEVALSLGNSTMKTSTLTPELKNAIARKINEKYYGSTTGKSGAEADWGKDNFSPVLYVENVQKHNCEFNDNGNCKQGTNCPYYKLQNGLNASHPQTYEVYTPEMINVQGVTGASATDAKYTWTHYDHTMYAYKRAEDMTEAEIAKWGAGKMPWATCGFTGNLTGRLYFNGIKPAQGSTPQKDRAEYFGTSWLAVDDYNVTISAKPTNMEGNPNYLDSDTGLYTASADRVIAMGQTGPATGKYSNGTLKMKIADHASNLRSPYVLHGHYINTEGSNKNGNVTWTKQDGTTTTTGVVGAYIDLKTDVGQYNYLASYSQAYCDGINSNTYYWDGRWGVWGDYDLADPENKQHGVLGYPYAASIWMGNGATNGKQIRRLYHMMDISYPEYTDSTYGKDAATSGKASWGNPDVVPEYAVTSGHFEKWYDASQPLAADKKMTKIANAGYEDGSYRDWLFLYNDQPTKKTIFFTIDDATCVAHASDGYGFFFNTTIRQSKPGVKHPDKKGDSDGSWRISGYMFYIGNPHTERYSGIANWEQSQTLTYEKLYQFITANGTANVQEKKDGVWTKTGTRAFDHQWTYTTQNGVNYARYNASQYKSENLSGYRWYIIKVDDVNLEHFADGSIRGAAGEGTSGYGHADAWLGSRRNLANADRIGGGGATGVVYYDDIVRYLMYGGDRTEGVNGNYWISVPYGTGAGQVPQLALYNDYAKMKTDTAAGKPNTTWYTSLEEYAAAKGIEVPGINYGIEQVAWSKMDVGSANGAASRYVRNYAIVTEGDSTRVYCYNSGKCYSNATNLTKNPASYPSLKELKEKFAHDVTEDNPDGASSYSAGYKAITWSNIHEDADVGYSDTLLLTERPTVDGVTIGMGVKTSDASATADATYTKQDFHTDSNCYGFGPLSSARSYSHYCGADTRIEFSNVSMEMNEMRNLSEVVTEPQWGAGKAKFIVSVADDSVNDFKDPILVSSLQWRVQNDNTRFIGWGAESNKATTEEFLNRIDNKGIYVVNDVRVRQTPAVQTTNKNAQVEKVAEYVANSYYEAFGLDGDENITAQVNSMAGAKGQVYSLEDVQKMHFSVQPAQYNTTTANEDYPSGRWYLIHDTTGYDNEPIQRSGHYSDALNLQISEPGRYTVYFAPDQKKVDAGTLDPVIDAKSCVFDFVVNQEATPQFTGKIDATTNTITLANLSEDDDTGRDWEEAKAYWDPKNTNGFWNTEAKALNIDQSKSAKQLTGITSVLWRWEIIQSAKDGGNATVIYRNKEVDSTGKPTWEVDPTWVTKAEGAGITLKELTNGKKVQFNASGQETTTLGAGSLSSLPNDAVLMVYQKVQDVSTIRRLDKTTGKFVYTVPAGGYHTSDAIQQNITTNSNVTLAANAAFNIDPVTEMYDTAEGENATLTITRASRHQQSNNTYQASFRVSTKTGEANWVPMTKGTGANDKNDWYVKVDANNVPSKTGTKTVKVLTNVKEPSVDGDGVGSGQWTINKDFIYNAVQGKADTFLSLGLQESLTGVPMGSTTGEEEVIVDSTSRAIYLRHDGTAPSAQTVTTKTFEKVGGVWDSGSDYEASNYLDVSQDSRKIVVEVNGSVDSQGAVGGYGFYFYEYGKDAEGKNTNNIEKIYTMNVSGNKASGALTEVTGSGSYISKIKTAVGWNAATKKGKCVLPASGGTITIDRSALMVTPVTRLNLAIFAFDNQTGITGDENVTGANEAVKTKIEDIKLASFTPMPPEITVKDSLGVNVAHIGNDKAFTGVAGDDVADPSTRANTNLTVEFKPRQGWFKVKGENRVYDETASADLDKTPTAPEGYTYSKYFMDISKAADLTNKAQIIYTLTKDGVKISEATADNPAEYTSVLSITESGEYTLTARVINGSKALSETRSVSFSIDKDAPAGLKVELTDNINAKTEDIEQWNNRNWYKDVTLKLSGATDRESGDKGRYMVSLDNGATWLKADGKTEGKSFSGGQSWIIPLNETKDYNIRVYATDEAGNKTKNYETRVRIDAQGPVMSPPSLTADAATVPLYKEYVVSIVETAGGTVHGFADGTENTADTEIVVPVQGSQQFKITPDKGFELKKVTCGTSEYVVGASDALQAQPDGSYILTVENVMSNMTLTADFLEAGNVAKAIAYNTEQALEALYSARAFSAGATRAGEGATYRVIPETSDLDAGYLTASAEEVAAGGSTTITVTPNTGYAVDYITVQIGTGEAVTVPTSDMLLDTDGKSYKYNVTGITGTVQVFGYFKKLVPHTLTLISDDQGKVSVTSGAKPSANGTYTFYQGDPIVLKFTPNSSSYAVTSLKVNGVEKGAVSGDTYTIEGTETTQDLTVNVEFGVSSGAMNIYLKCGEHGRVTPLGQPDSDPNPFYSQEGEFKNDRYLGSNVVTAAYGGNRTFTVTPDFGYEPHLSLTYFSPDGETTGYVTQDNVPMIKSVDGNTYTYTLSNVVDTSNLLEFTFTQKTYNVTVSNPSGNGNVIITDPSGKELTTENLQVVPEGTSLNVHIVPDDGYRIAGLVVGDSIESGEEDVVVGGVSVGCRREYKLESVQKDYAIQVSFVPVEFVTSVSSHTISVTAENIHDNEQSLHPTETYSFRLLDGDGKVVLDWSRYQSSPNYVYDLNKLELTPNTKYTVVVRAKDAVGNESSATASASNSASIYTRANPPTAVSLDTDETQENAEGKTVVMKVEPNGNPEYTRYRVYKSKYTTMAYREVATLQGGVDGWAKLDSENCLYITGLDAGVPYHMQVVAENDADQLMDDSGKPKQAVATEANNQNVLDILLAPVAPGENTMCFIEQPGPNQSVTLKWDRAGGSVTGYAIYRDGVLIHTADPENTATMTWTDDTIKDPSDQDESGSIGGDTFYKYSYAYVNSVGAGSRRTAVSEDYYNVAHDLSSGALAKRQAMDALVTTKDSAGKDVVDSAAFSQTMTYPTYPTDVEVKDHESGFSEDSGHISVYIRSQSARRSQKYQVGLQAYSVDEAGKYTEVPGWQWDSDTYLKWTTATTSKGAFVEWYNLPINYEYRIKVKTVKSTGPRITEGTTIKDGYDGQTNSGVEYTLGKYCEVSKEGYRYSFTNDEAKALLVHYDNYIPWSGDASLKYTGYAGVSGSGEESGPTGWDAPIGKEYIKFNKSAQIRLADDPLKSSKEMGWEVVSLFGSDTLIIDRSKEDMTFKIDVKVWDPDGPENDSSTYVMKGVLENVTGVGPEGIKSVAKTEKEANTYTITFDASQFGTGTYGELALSVSDGGSTSQRTQEDEGEDLTKWPGVMVNKIMPNITSSNNGVTKNIEKGRNYGPASSSVIKVASSITTGNEETRYSMRLVRLNVMDSQYDELFGTHNELDIQKALNNADNANHAKAVASAQKLLGDSYDTIAAGGFDSNETADLIEKVTPPVTAYFQITKEQFDAASDKTKVLKDQNGDYWAQTDYALDNDLCQFLTKAKADDAAKKVKTGDIIVTGTDNTAYGVKLVSSFGGNTASKNIYFLVMDAPSITVRTNKVWKWQNANSEEFKAFKLEDRTIGDMATMYAASYNVKPWEQNPAFTEGLKAYRPEDATGDDTDTNRNYEVFKLMDDEVTVTDSTIQPTLDVDSGVYGSIDNVKALLSKDSTWKPTEATENDADKVQVITSGTGSSNHILPDSTSNGYRFRVSGLDPNTTYYMWIAYDLTDPDSKVVTRHYVSNYTAITTADNYATSFISYDSTFDRQNENDEAAASGKRLNYAVSRTGDMTPAITLIPTVKYFAADQFGNIMKDKETGEEIELTGEQLAAAQQTLYVNTDIREGKVHFNTYPGQSNNDSDSFQMILKDTTDMQGHMVAKVTLIPDPTTQKGYYDLPDNGKTLFIFVLDDESPVTNYVVGFDDVEGVTEGEARTEPGKYYEYNFVGLKNGYGGAVGSLTLSLRNDGDGAIENLTAELFEADQTTPSTDFSISQAPNPSLSEGLSETAKKERTEVTVVPGTLLTDGVYEGWLKLTWNQDLMDKNDTIWIHLHQVVGQTTLKGTLYLTEHMPTEDSTTFVGKSLVKLYDYNVTDFANSTPVYEKYTDNYGRYEIPNIINNENKGKRYWIVIERPGFLTYNSRNLFGRVAGVFEAKESVDYVLNLQLLGGDIDGDGDIDATDYAAFGENYNQTYDPAAADAPIEMVKRDYNADGVVNALDRMVIWSNQRMGVSGSKLYPYQVAQNGTYVPIMPAKVVE